MRGHDSAGGALRSPVHSCMLRQLAESPMAPGGLLMGAQLRQLFKRAAAATAGAETTAKMVQRYHPRSRARKRHMEDDEAVVEYVAATAKKDKQVVAQTASAADGTEGANGEPLDAAAADGAGTGIASVVAEEAVAAQKGTAGMVAAGALTLKTSNEDSLGQFALKETDETAEGGVTEAAVEAAVERVYETGYVTISPTISPTASEGGTASDAPSALTGITSELQETVVDVVARAGRLVPELRAAFAKAIRRQKLQQQRQRRGQGTGPAQNGMVLPVLTLDQIAGPGSRHGTSRLAACRLLFDLLVLNSAGYVRLMQEPYYGEEMSAPGGRGGGQEPSEKAPDDVPPLIGALSIEPTSKLLTGGGSAFPAVD